MTTSRLAALAFAAAASSATGGDTLVQVSTIDALVQGIYDGGTRFKELKKSGDFGIGTLNHLDGEMLALDGRFLQIASDGTVREITDEIETPFAAVTFFEAEKTFPLGAFASLDTLQAKLDRELESPNLFHAVRIDGSFVRVNVRSVTRQEPPFRPLTEVVKEQSTFELEELRGTLVGFRCPSFVKGLNVPGYHFHFIRGDGKSGGHVLDCVFEEGEARLDPLENLTILLPREGPFLGADFSEHDEAAIHAVEKPGAAGER